MLFSAACAILSACLFISPAWSFSDGHPQRRQSGLAARAPSNWDVQIVTASLVHVASMPMTISVVLRDTRNGVTFSCVVPYPNKEDLHDGKASNCKHSDYQVNIKTPDGVGFAWTDATEYHYTVTSVRGGIKSAAQSLTVLCAGESGGQWYKPDLYCGYLPT